MKNRWFKTEAAKYALYGIIFGFLFPIIAITIDLLRMDLSFSVNNIIYVHKNFPIHFIIDTAPFFLGLFAFLGGLAMDKVKEQNKLILLNAKFKDTFLANMSHEIRTPMAGVIGVIDLLSKSNNLNETERNHIEIIHQSSNDLLKIINEILDLSKLEAGKLDIHTTTINFRALINHVYGLFLATSKSKKINLITDISEEIPEYIKIDGNRINQILSNLVGNAIKFSDKGTIKIKSTLVEEQEDTIKVKIEVIDQGIGISQQEQECLFSEFKQANCNKSKPGTGLGLHISKKLVHLMDGDIGVISEIDKGSTFWFTFNTVKSTINTHKGVNNKKAVLSSTNENLKIGLHVLLAEDNKMICEVIKHMLLRLGCSIEIANNGKIAIEKFKQQKFDLVLMDIQMPEMDGIETTTYIKNNFSDRPPIIGLSANALKGDAEKYISMGLDDYLTKPLTSITLKNKLQEWFKKEEVI
ncbi:response regulator [Flavobacteriaceae bacterium R38]|nr:response regulator [Flavobacteriaceae bacterium R38]